MKNLPFVALVIFPVWLSAQCASVTSLPPIDGPAQFCDGQIATYRLSAPVTSLDTVACGPVILTWAIEPMTTGVQILAEGGDSIQVQFPAGNTGAPLIVTIAVDGQSDSTQFTESFTTVIEASPIDLSLQEVRYCLGDSVVWEGQSWLPSPGELLEVTYATPNGCDSLVTGIAIPLLPSTVVLPEIYCCASDGDCPPEGVFVVIYPPNYQGCDSTGYADVYHYPSPQTDLDTLVLTGMDTLTVGGTSYTGLDAGNYTVTLETYLGCDSTVRFVIVDETTTGISPVAAVHWSISPNPTAGDIQLAIDEPLPPRAELKIRDTAGRLRAVYPLQTGRQRLQLTDLPAGIYLLGYRAADGTYRSRRLLHAPR